MKTMVRNRIAVVVILLTLVLLAVGEVTAVFAAAPSNDDIFFATVIGTLPYTDTVDTTEATVEVDEPVYSCGNGVGATVWYSYTPSVTTEVMVTTSGSDFSDVLHVYDSVEPLTLVGCGYGGNSLDAQVTFSATAGNTYLISAGGNYSNSGNLVLSMFEVGAYTSCGTMVDVTETECLAITDLYDTTLGGSWTDNTRWKQTDRACTWYGVNCHDGLVVGLKLGYNNLEGVLNTVDLTSLVDLTLLDFTSNVLSGDMSLVIGNFPTGIQYLRMPWNSFTGTIPAGINGFSSLSELDLLGNLLAGDIAAVFPNLPVTIHFLNLGSNQFYGTIPPSASGLTNLYNLQLHDNLLSGDLSTVIGNLPTGLGILSIGWNDFFGTVPMGISNLTNLWYLSLGRNQLDGDLGTIIGYLPTSILMLLLYENNFTGTVPPAISGFSGLTNLNVGSNQLDGDLSTIIGYLPGTIKSLDLADNDFTGSIPAGISSLTSLVSISLEDNPGLNGIIPISITGIPLAYFNFQHTFLCEPMVEAYDIWKAGVTDYYPGFCVPSSSRLFEDDFETNDFSLWTRFNDGKGYLYPCTIGAINGYHGACVERGTDKRKQLIDETPINQNEYNVRFNIDINSLSMAAGTRFRFIQVKMGAERPFFIVLKYQGGQYLVQLNTLLDDLTKVKSGWHVLSDAPHTLEITWSQASGDGDDNGAAAFFIDDVFMESLGKLDNDTIYVDTFKIGFTSRLDGKPIAGTFYLDDIATANDGHIGLP